MAQTGLATWALLVERLLHTWMDPWQETTDG